MKLTPAQIRVKVEKAIDREKTFIDYCKTNQRSNPQVIEMRLRAEGKLDALEAVRDALKGDNVFLNLLADGAG